MNTTTGASPHLQLYNLILQERMSLNAWEIGASESASVDQPVNRVKKTPPPYDAREFGKKLEAVLKLIKPRNAGLTSFVLLAWDCAEEAMPVDWLVKRTGDALMAAEKLALSNAPEWGFYRRIREVVWFERVGDVTPLPDWRSTEVSNAVTNEDILQILAVRDARYYSVRTPVHSTPVVVMFDYTFSLAGVVLRVDQLDYNADKGLHARPYCICLEPNGEGVYCFNCGLHFAPGKG